jgi:spore coat polysaccharide biosynthesis predicted glycosyltransferase SpsG
MNRLIVRADASPSIGLGHVMRSLAYAEAARDRGIDALFVVSTDGLGAELASRRGFSVLGVSNPESTSWGEILNSGDAVLFDAYHLSAHALGASARPGVLTAVMDDAVRAEHVDLVICPDSGAIPEGLPPHCAALCGMEYAPIRREFAMRRRLRGGDAEHGSLIVVLGGADTTGLTPAAVRAAASHRSRAFSGIEVVLGPGAADWETADVVQGVRIVRDPARLHELFDGAGAAISAAGTTSWELFCMGVPTALIAVNPTQTPAAGEAQAAGAAIYLGAGRAALETIPRALSTLEDPLTRQRLSAAALAFLDGRGADRVIDELEGLAQSI